MLTNENLDLFRTIIVRPIITEKSMRQSEELRKYHFKVHPNANKVQIHDAIEALFNVRVNTVRTMNVRGKSRRKSYRYRMGKTARWKKAIVTLAPGNTIDIVQTS